MGAGCDALRCERACHGYEWLARSYRRGWSATEAAGQQKCSYATRQQPANRVQLTSDGHKAYLEGVEQSFGAEIDYVQLIKIYGEAQCSSRSL